MGTRDSGAPPGCKDGSWAVRGPEERSIPDNEAAVVLHKACLCDTSQVVHAIAGSTGHLVNPSILAVEADGWCLVGRLWQGCRQKDKAILDHREAPERAGDPITPRCIKLVPLQARQRL